MKKPLLLSLILLIIIFVSALILAIVLSFKVVRQTTDKIVLNQKQNFQNFIRIPDAAAPSLKIFDTTAYEWEMETRAGEVAKVKFSYDTGFNKHLSEVTATLEIEQGQDPSIFNKVLPAVVSDMQAVNSANDFKHQNLGSNEKIGYEKISMVPVEGRENQVSQITWVFKRDIFVNQNKDLYRKLDLFPAPILKFLYGLQNFILQLFRG